MKSISKYHLLCCVSPFITILDQVTKWYVRDIIPLGERIPVIDGFFDIVHFRNTGAAFGMFSSLSPEIRPFFFYGISVIAVLLLGAYFRSLREEEKVAAFSLSLVFGGMVGNLIDRFRFGNVVDFLSFHIGEKHISSLPLEWPAFNVADSAITIAMLLLIWLTFKDKR